MCSQCRSLLLKKVPVRINCMGWKISDLARAIVNIWPVSCSWSVQWLAVLTDRLVLLSLKGPTVRDDVQRGFVQLLTQGLTESDGDYRRQALRRLGSVDSQGCSSDEEDRLNWAGNIPSNEFTKVIFGFPNARRGGSWGYLDSEMPGICFRCFCITAVRKRYGQSLLKWCWQPSQDKKDMVLRKEALDPSVDV